MENCTSLEFSNFVQECQVCFEIKVMQLCNVVNHSTYGPKRSNNSGIFDAITVEVNEEERHCNNGSFKLTSFTGCCGNQIVHCIGVDSVGFENCSFCVIFVNCFVVK
jgi:hypothetical protein